MFCEVQVIKMHHVTRQATEFPQHNISSRAFPMFIIHEMSSASLQFPHGSSSVEVIEIGKLITLQTDNLRDLDERR